MEGYKDSTTLYAKALDSAGIAQKKFDLYQQGTEAQLNRLKASFEAVWMSAFKSDTLQTLITGLNQLVNGVNIVVSHIGMLPVTIGTASIAFMMFNKGINANIMKFGILTNSLARTGDAMVIGSAKSKMFQSAMYSMTLAGRATGVAMTFLGKAISGAFNFLKVTALPIAGIMAVGYAIEKITEYISKQRQEAQELQKKEQQLVTSYKSHKDEVSQLASEYESLSNAKNNGGLNNDQEQKYVDVQNKLARILPTIKIGETAKGNAILKSSTAIKEQIKLLEREIELQGKKSILDAPQKIAKTASNIGDDQKEVEKQKNLVDQWKIAAEHGKEDKVNHSIILSYLKNENEALLKQNEAESKINAERQKSAQLIKGYFSGTKIDTTSITEISSALSGISLKGKDVGEIDTFFKVASEDINKLAKALKDNNEKGIKEAEKGLEGLGIKGKVLKAIIDILTNTEDKNTDSKSKQKDATKNAADEQAKYAAQLQETIDAEMEKANAEEQIVGSTQNLINKAKEQIAIYNMLNGLQNRSAEQEQALADAKQYLASIYPALVQGENLNIDAMGREAEQQDILLKALTDVANGHASAEEKKTTNAALGARARLQIMNAELKALQQMAEAYDADMVEMINKASQLQKAGFGGDDQALITAQKLHISQQRTIAAISSKKHEINVAIPSYDGIFKKLAKETNYEGNYYKSPSNSGSSKGSKGTGSNKSTDDKIEKTIKPYETSIGDYDQQIKQSQATQKRYTEGSKDWIAQQNIQIGLIKKQKTESENEEKALQKLQKTTKLNDDQKKEVNSRIKELNANQAEYTTSIKEMNEAIVDTKIDGVINKWQKAVDGYDKTIQTSEDNLSKYVEGSKAWNTQLNNEIAALEKKKKANQSEISDLQKLAKTKGLTQSQKDKINSEISSKTSDNTDTQNTIDEKKWQESQAVITSYDTAVESLNDKLTLSKDKMDSFAEGSTEYLSELKNQVTIINQEIDQYSKKITEITNKLKDKSLTPAQQAQLNKELAETNIQLQESKNNVKDLSQNVKDLSDNYVNFISDTLTKQKEENLQHLQDKFDAINKQLENLIKQDDSFDFGNFSDSIDEIINRLDEMDGKFKSNALFVTDTSSTRNNIDVTIDRIKTLQKQVEEYVNTTSDDQDGLTNMIKSESERANELADSLKAVDNMIRDRKLEYQQIEDALQNQIDLKQKQLDQLDEEYQKEDKLKQLQDLVDQRDQAKADKRFKVIDSTGKETLTYDKGKVDDLNKQIDDMNTQNARDAAKQALQDQINAMQDNLSKTKQTHQSELDELQAYRDAGASLYQDLVNDVSAKKDKLKELHDQEVKDTTKHWDDLISAATTGTLTFKALMDGWYTTTIQDMKTYNTDVANQLAQLQKAFTDMQNLSTNMPNISVPTTPKSYTVQWNDPKTKKTVTQSVTTMQDAQKLVTANASNSPQIIPKYHEGGIVGLNSTPNRLTELANKIFNVQPGEMLTKQLIGELDIAPKNIPNGLTNIRNMMNAILPKIPTIVQSGDTITLNNVTIQTKDASTFLPDLQRIISTRKS